MHTNMNKIKRTCRLCLMNTERHKRYELFVKSEVENFGCLDNDAADSAECQQDGFSNMILYEKVEYCCGIRLAPKSELPSKICGKCFYMIHMWFNFRQMSCNSQIFLSTQTNIKLEDVWMTRNSLELQQMRCVLLRTKEKKEDVEFITPDTVKDADNKYNYCTEKIEVSETEVLFPKENGFGVDAPEDVDIEQKNMATKSNDEELDDSDSLMCTEEKSDFSVEEEFNTSNKSREDSSSNSKEEECVAEIIPNSACNEGISKFDNLKASCLTDYQDSIDEEDCNDEIDAGKEIKSASSNEKNRINYFSSKYSVTEVGSQKNVNENSLRDNEQIDENRALLDGEGYAANVCDNNDSDDNIQRDLNLLLSDNEGEHLNETNEQCKSENTSLRRRNTKNNKAVTRSKSVLHVHDKEIIQSKYIFPPNTEYKKLEQPDKYICNICANVYKNYKLFKQHMRTHSEEKPYTCEFCEKAFRTAAFLKCHMSVHTGEKRYKCKYCKLHYTDASSRHRHEKTHTDNPKYNCNTCGKSFMYKTVLRRHAKLHSGEKLFSCAVCNSSFSLPHHLKSHIKTTTHLEKQKAYEALGFQIVFETRETPYS